MAFSFTMKTKKEILSILKTCRPELEKKFPIKRLALFGSQVSGEADQKSDVDILVEVDPVIGLGFVTLAERLEELLEIRVDLVSRRAIKPSLWKQIEPELIDV
jgi:predicted nucleotidyltransferase